MDPAGGRVRVLFLCTHDAGRSQMAVALLTAYAGERVDATSAGTHPAADVDPLCLAALAEIGVPPPGVRPRAATDEIVDAADVVVGMAGEDPFTGHPGRLDWDVPDPAGEPDVVVRAIRDDIERRVKVLAHRLTLR